MVVLALVVEDEPVPHGRRKAKVSMALSDVERKEVVAPLNF